VSEYELHCAIWDYMAWAVLPPTVCFTVGHGGYKLTKRAAVRLKRAGLVPGIPDVALIHDGRAHFIEIKTATGRLSPDQVMMRDRLAASGARVATARSVPEVERLLDAWSIPHRKIYL
jgi:hypothetical protein